MDTRVAYWTTDANGGLTLFNQAGQKLTTVPVAQAASYIDAYSKGNPAATDIGKSFAGTGTSTSGSATAAQSSTAAQQNATRAEDQRQFDLTQAERKARGDQSMQLDQAKLEWQKAIDARDFSTAEKWKQVSADLAERQFKASISGPQDWVKYWKDSRGGTSAAPATTSTSVPSWATATPAVAQAPVSNVPKWTQSAPGWQQGATVTSPTVADLAAHGPTTATTFTGQNGVPIDFSGSEWMKKQTAAMPNWMTK